MISYHPDSRFLTDFASANLSVAEAVCVSAHLEFCGKCRGHVQQLKDVGAHLLTQLPPEELEADSFAQLMSRISSAGQVSPVSTASSSELEQHDAAPRQDSARALADVVLPRSLRGLCGDGLNGLSWARLGKALRIAPLPILGESRETAIYDIKAGERTRH
jgi:putative transcriptional regulator